MDEPDHAQGLRELDNGGAHLVLCPSSSDTVKFSAFQNGLKGFHIQTQTGGIAEADAMDQCIRGYDWHYNRSMVRTA